VRRVLPRDRLRRIVSFAVADVSREMRNEELREGNRRDDCRRERLLRDDKSRIDREYSATCR